MTWEPVFATAGAAVLLTLGAWSSARSLSRLRDEDRRAEEAWRALSNRRLQAARSLASSARRYLTPDIAAVDALDRAIAGAEAATDLPSRRRADESVSRATADLQRLAPDYPEFRANADVHQVRSQLDIDEPALTEAATVAHEARRAFNRRLARFPASFFARRRGWGRLPE